MSGLSGTLIVVLAFSGMAAVASIGGGHSHGDPHHVLDENHGGKHSHGNQGDPNHGQEENLGGQHRRGGVMQPARDVAKQLFGENFNKFHRVEDLHKSDSDIHHGNHDVVFDYENLNHEDESDQHDDGQHHPHN